MRVEVVASLSTNELTSPPSSAGATLSGWPSSAQASSSARSRSKPSPESAIAAAMPAITHAELEPRPPESGMGERIVM